jgi:DNA (cytosine-5)-methyltransferase 1
MIPSLNFASAFTGIGGFELAFQRAGIATTALIELEKNRAPCLREQFPDTPLMIGDIADVSGTDLGRIDGIAAGFPCKDISRGKGDRRGLAGDQSSTFFNVPRLVDEYARLVDATNPRWVILENSPDLITSRWNGGRDMGTALWTMVELGYGMAWRVLDARGFGTPQQRRRVVLVGHRGGDPRPAGQVLGLLEGVAGPADTSHDWVPDPGPHTGPFAFGGDLVRVWRKGARPTKAITFGYEGGYRETWVDDGRGNTLTAYDGPSNTRQTHLVSQGGRIRTLTAIEWERLQGFPDNWTAPMSRTARFDALGNAMHVGMAEWLGRRIVDVSNALPMIGAAA